MESKPVGAVVVTSRRTPEELRALALEVLEAVATGKGGRGAASRVAAARALLDASDPLAELERLLGGPEQALSWMREMLPRLEAKVAATLTEGGDRER